MEGFVNSLKTITFICLLGVIIILGSRLESKERYLEPFIPPVPKPVQNASLVPITADMCRDYTFMHSTPEMQRWCRDIGMLDGSY